MEFLDHKFAVPIVIEDMTGGHPNTTDINQSLAAAAAGKTGIAMGVRSQRAGLETDDKDVLACYTAVREVTPDAFLYGNLGAAQL